MPEYEKICDLNSQVEAMTLKAALEQREIPFMVQSHEDSAYDGLFQLGRGWGHIEAPTEYADEIRSVLNEIREQSGASEQSKEGERASTLDRESMWTLIKVIMAALVLAAILLWAVG